MTETTSDPFATAAVATSERFSSGYSWPECPRWHDGALHLTDMYNHRLLRLDEAGAPEVVIDGSQRESRNGAEVIFGGFGWFPDGRIVVNSMHERLVLAWDGNELTEHADLSGLATGPINDMVVDTDGRCYITQLGFELFRGEDARPSPLLVVEPDGSARVLAELGEFQCANGIAISPDGASVVTVEAFGTTVHAFDRDSEGSLSRPHAFGELPAPGDGMCLDGEGAAWLCSPAGGFVARMLDGGTLTDVVRFDRTEVIPVACVLGGADRKTLYVAGGVEVFDWEKSRREAKGSIWTASVDTGGGQARP
ncbi:SMP-30/gluconolactonase/LRE family protein [Saccharopolyspora gregorii]|uniref:SMP-30/gluconolactonase/LRE family protein n=1 Tax=Saccharopolyspora gregorii TaxID=33914 RepID=UPI0021AC58FF|nr:SMP-30/gluconolactonase/LRE family protein [Saccharopolyspora gregorii]